VSGSCILHVGVHVAPNPHVSCLFILFPRPPPRRRALRHSSDIRSKSCLKINYTSLRHESVSHGAHSAPFLLVPFNHCWATRKVEVWQNDWIEGRFAIWPWALVCMTSYPAQPPVEHSAASHSHSSGLLHQFFARPISAAFHDRMDIISDIGKHD
jgi:hypothetical protein